MSAPESSKRTEPLPGIEYVTPVSPVINLAGKLKLLFTREEIDDLNKPKVSISGGGIGGLTLALLLHKANIPFLVLERAKEIKALGQPEALDPEEFPILKEERNRFDSVLGVSTIALVCWVIIQFLDKESAKMNDSFRNSEWGPEAAEALAREVRMFKVPGGKNGNVITLGDYIDKTPRDLMSKVMLKEIVFDTWYDGQTVLLGDAKPKDIENVFKEYHAERYPVAKANFESSQLFIRNMGK
ncbi:hypothetical protein BG005_009499, partial [Podila minutissima]